MKKGWAFASGILVGSVGLSVLTSKLVMKGYKYVFAGAMIARDRIMADSEKVQAAVRSSTMRSWTRSMRRRTPKRKPRPRKPEQGGPEA